MRWIKALFCLESPRIVEEKEVETALDEELLAMLSSGSWISRNSGERIVTELLKRLVRRQVQNGVQNLK